MTEKTPTVCWNAIVKNEASVIRRCMQALVDHIDYWVVVDTGSTDGTQQIIQDFMLLHGIEGELHDMPWKNFGYNRTRALEFAENKADYLLFCDADMELKVHDPKWQQSLNSDAYNVTQVTNSGLAYQNKRLIDARLEGDKRWRYWSTTHEYCDSIEPNLNTVGYTDVISFQDYADGGSKADKFQRDITLLMEQLVELKGLDALDPQARAKASESGLLRHRKILLPRTLFYLAQSYRDLDDYQNAIDAYSERSEVGGWSEEVWYSLYQIGVLLDRMNASSASIAHALLKAYEFRPTRAEPLWYLSSYYRRSQQYHLAYLFASRAVNIPQPDDILFVSESVYQWEALDELAVAAYWTGQMQESRDCNRKLLAMDSLPFDQRARIEKNSQYSEEALVS